MKKFIATMMLLALTILSTTLNSTATMTTNTDDSLGLRGSPPATAECKAMTSSGFTVNSKSTTSINTATNTSAVKETSPLIAANAVNNFDANAAMLAKYRKPTGNVTYALHNGRVRPPASLQANIISSSMKANHANARATKRSTSTIANTTYGNYNLAQELQV